MSLIFPPSAPYVASAQSKTILKLRASIGEAAAMTNPLLRTPLIPPPAWVASTAYSKGQVVQNGGKQYICGAPGTSASSGGPSGTGSGYASAGPITDGTVSWYFENRFALPAATSALAPAVSYASSMPADLTLKYPAVVSNAVSPNFFYSGGVQTVYSTNMLSFPAVNMGTNAGYTNPSANHYGTNNPHVSFVTDAPRVMLSGVNAAFQPTMPVKVYVDDVLLQPGVLVPAANNWYGLLLDFTSAGGRKRRKITVFYNFWQPFDGVYVDPASTVEAPQSRNRTRVACLGSSLTAGGGSPIMFPLAPDRDWPSQLGFLLGTDDVWNLGVGSNGFLTAAGSTLTYRGRITDCTNPNPDVLVIEGNHNDGTFTAGQQTAEIVAFLRAFRADCPNAVIIVFGSEAWDQISATQEPNVLAAVTQFADPWTFYIPVAAAPEGSPITGTANVTTAGSTAGTSAVTVCPDGIHPIQYGIDRHTDWKFAKIRALLGV